MSEMQVFEGNFEQRQHNTPLEYGFRALFILDAADNVAMDLQRIVSYDYLLVHTSDVPRGLKAFIQQFLTGEQSFLLSEAQFRQGCI